jgi:hypothetical protein
MKRNQSRYWRQQRGIHAQRLSNFARYSGIITLRKKPLGSVKKLFEKITLTYLLAILKLKGELHLKGVSL